jgi:hypothetical protein
MPGSPSAAPGVAEGARPIAPEARVSPTGDQAGANTASAAPPLLCQMETRFICQGCGRYRISLVAAALHPAR